MRIRVINDAAAALFSECAIIEGHVLFENVIEQDAAQGGDNSRILGQGFGCIRFIFNDTAVMILG